MNKKTLLTVSFSILFILALVKLPIQASAQNMSSDNYEIIDPTINSGGDDSSSSDNYKMEFSAGGEFNDERFESSNYKVGSGTGYTFMANVPKISYFEANDEKMNNICGYGGCYDRARFEIDPQNNPEDTLYSIEISDNDWSTVNYVDGITHQIKTNKDIDDYQTINSWQNGSWSEYNILGLNSQTEYKIRARALHGDFTESSPGPEKSTNTTNTTIFMDLDVSSESWRSSNPPYNITLGNISTNSVVTAPNYIWTSIGTNAQGGATISAYDLHGGLYSNNTDNLIESKNQNLETADSGFGIRIDTSKRLLDTGDPGYLRENLEYASSETNSVGGLSSSDHSYKVVLCTLRESTGHCNQGTGAPVHLSRTAIMLKAKASLQDEASDDYSDTITFSSIGTF